MSEQSRIAGSIPAMRIDNSIVEHGLDTAKEIGP